MESTSTPPPASSDDLLRLRDGLWHQGSVSNSAELRAAAERDPRGIGLQLAGEKKYHEAVPLLQRAIVLKPADFEAHLWLGRSLAATSRWPAAEPILERAVALRPKSAEAHFYYGDVLLKVGKFAAAEAEFCATLRNRPWWKKITTAIRARIQPQPKYRLDINPATYDPAAKLAFATHRRENIEYARSRITDEDPNASWKKAERGRRIHIQNTPIIRRDTKIFAIGSCFALEIRHELARRGFDVYPKYSEIQFDPKSQILNSLPDRDNINHYDTFTIRQEFEQAFGEQHFSPGDFWQVEGRTINKVMGRGTVWQDPYRKNVYAGKAAEIADLSRKLDDCIRAGLLAADVYVITLGLIETWRNTKNGLHACSYPGTGGGGGAGIQSELHVAGFQENYENMRRVCELVFQRFPEKQIILTVSPVALERTFRDLDVVIANMESKATLRAVAGQICREFPNVHYLPSYELFAYHDLFHDNGRHATRDGVEVVLDLFGQCFLAPDAAAKTA